MPKWELRSITKIEIKKNYHLICTFDNGVIKDFDMSKIVLQKGTMIEPLKGQTFFKKVFLEMGTPTWPNGYDVCSDLIYTEGKEITYTKKAA